MFVTLNYILYYKFKTKPLVFRYTLLFFDTCIYEVFSNTNYSNCTPDRRHTRLTNSKIMQLIAKIYLPTLSWSGKRCRDSGPPTYQIINRTAHKHFTGLIRPTSIFTNDLSVYNTSFGSVFTRCCQGTLLKPTVQWGSAVGANCPSKVREPAMSRESGVKYQLLSVTTSVERFFVKNLIMSCSGPGAVTLL